MTSQQVFERFVPLTAVHYCIELYEAHRFEFKIKRSRRTKLGDYRYDPKNGKQTITINNDLNPYAFLITYLHEVAHYIAFNKYGRKIAPHGTEWKRAFQKVAAPMLTDQVFPPAVLTALNRYFKNPKASSCADPELYQVLKQFDNKGDTTLLKDIAIGYSFQFNGRTFVKLETKRTRSLCQEHASGRKYMISDLAEVTKVQGEN